MFSSWREARLFSSDNTAVRNIGSQPNGKSISLRMRCNSHDLNRFGIYERDKPETESGSVSDDFDFGGTIDRNEKAT